MVDGLARPSTTSRSVTILSPPELEVAIDLKPENAENAVDPFNLGSNKPVAVAVFSTADFDAATIVPTSVVLGDPTLVPAALPALSSTVTDVNGDGLLDAVFDFGPARKFAEAGALDASSVEVLLTGLTSDGTSIHGTDAITIVGK